MEKQRRVGQIRVLRGQYSRRAREIRADVGQHGVILPEQGGEQELSALARIVRSAQLDQTVPLDGSAFCQLGLDTLTLPATPLCTSLHSAIPCVTVSHERKVEQLPTFARFCSPGRQSEPSEIMLSSNGAEVERMSNVGRCRIGKDGMNRVQNICRHVSSQAAEGLVTAAVVRSDWASALGPVRFGIIPN